MLHSRNGQRGRAGRWLRGRIRNALSCPGASPGEGNPVRLVFPPEIIGPAAGDDRGPCFFVLAHGLWVWFAP